MNILYYGFDGAGPDMFLYIFMLAITILAAVGIIIWAIVEKDWAPLLFLIFTLIPFAIACIFKSDRRIPIVKATMNETIPFIEINDRFEFKKQEGDIYIFKVRNTTNEEWEEVIKEHNN